MSSHPENAAVNVDKGISIPTYRSIQNGQMPPISAVNHSGEKTNTEGSKTTSTASYKIQYRVYRWRWFMLLAVCLLNISNGMMWLSFAPIPDYTASYYSVSVDDVDWFSIIYFIVSLIMGFIAIFLLDKTGLKLSLYIGATLNLVGSGIRLVSSVDALICSSVPKAGFYVALLGQTLTAMAQPFILYSPTTLAAVWFGPKERAICTNFASVANPIGLAVAQLASPYIVTTVNKIPMMLWIYTIPAGVTFILTLVSFWWKEPPIPPAPSGDRDHIPPFFKGVLQVLKNWSFWVLLIFWGGAAGLFNALLTLLPQILCPYGYSDRDSGLWGALMIFFGLIGATIAGLIIDYTKKYKETSVISVACAVLCFIFFMEVSTLQDQSVLIAVSLCLFGLFALALIPVCMELGVEITYPVAESISSGLLWSAAQILGIVIVFISQALQTPMSPDLIPINQCGSEIDTDNSSIPVCLQSHNASIPAEIETSTQLVELRAAMIFCPTLTALLYVFYTIFFHPKYKRIEAEKRASFEESMFVGTGVRK